MSMAEKLKKGFSFFLMSMGISVYPKKKSAPTAPAQPKPPAAS